MCRRDVGENVIEITHGSTTDRWLVVKKMLDASQISLQAKSGVEVESTEIALAFPILGKTRAYAQVYLRLLLYLFKRKCGFKLVCCNLRLGMILSLSILGIARKAASFCILASQKLWIQICDTG